MIDDTLMDRIKNCGLKCNYIAEEIGVSKSLLSHFLANRRKLDYIKTQQLIEIIEMHEQLKQIN